MLDLMPYLGQFGPPAIAALAVVGVLRGWLVPGRLHERMIVDKDKQIDRLKEENDTLVRQRDELMELARTTVSAIEALPRSRERL